MSDPYDLAALYGRLWDPHTPWSVYLRMLWELYGQHLDADENPNVRPGLNLTRFQADGVLRMERLLEEHGGVLVADEVGLGKTFLAGEIMYRTANVNRQRVLIVAPAALKSSMWEPFLEAHDFSRWVKVYSYEEVRNRLDADKGPIDAFLKEIEDYSLVVIDEAHNLRNSGAVSYTHLDVYKRQVEIFAKIRQAPRLDAKRPGWDFRPVAEFHATNDRSVFDSGLGEGGGRIPVIAGAGFNLWQPETGEVYAWADPARVEEALFSKRQNQSRLKRSAFYGLPAAEVADRDTLPFHHPRIAFRDVCRATDTRTCIAALIPARTCLLYTSRCV